MLAPGAIGKAAAATLAVTLYLTGDMALLPPVVVAGDFLFAAFWGYYLLYPGRKQL